MKTLAHPTCVKVSGYITSDTMLVPGEFSFLSGPKSETKCRTRSVEILSSVPHTNYFYLLYEANNIFLAKGFSRCVVGGCF